MLVAAKDILEAWKTWANIGEVAATCGMQYGSAYMRLERMRKKGEVSARYSTKDPKKLQYLATKVFKVPDPDPGFGMAIPKPEGKRVQLVRTSERTGKFKAETHTVKRAKQLNAQMRKEKFINDIADAVVRRLAAKLGG